MKTYMPLYFLLFAFSMLATYSCDQTRKVQQDIPAAAAPTPDPDMVAWNKNLAAYHDIMSSTFHPAEDGNLQPLKNQAASLAARASEWALGPVPAKYKGKVDGILKQLADESQKVANMVQDKASDKDLTMAITKLHDLFHSVMEQGGGH